MNTGDGRVGMSPVPAVHESQSPIEGFSVYESVLVMRFKNDLGCIRQIKSRIRRIERKQSILSDYQAWLDDFLNRQCWENSEANMFVWLLLWHIDVGDWQRSLVLARLALSAGFVSPKDFARTLAETVCEEIADGILKTAEPSLHTEVLETLAVLVAEEDMTDQITAKLYKARGLARLATEPETARELFLQALKLDPDAGVKRLLKLLESSHKPKTRTPADQLQAFSLSALAAAKLINMTAPAFLRHAKKRPDLLPRLEIPIGKRTLYRFNPKHVREYMKQHLIKEV